MRRVIALVTMATLMCGACDSATSLAAPSAAESMTTAPTAARATSAQSPRPSPHPTPTLPPGVIGVTDLSYRPSAIVSDGELIWAEDHASTDQVYAIDPASGRTVVKIGIGRPCDLVVAFGRVWVADLDGGHLVWIDPATRTVAGDVSGLRGPCGPQAVGGSIWLAVDDGLARVDPESATARITNLDGAAFPAAGMPLWAALYDSGDLLSVDPASGAVTRTVRALGEGTKGPPVTVAFGSVWVGDTTSDRVYRLDPKTGATTVAIDVTWPTRLLATADSIWLTSFDKGVVERIDPTSDDVVFRTNVGGNPNGIAEAAGSIWVADTGVGRLLRIDPAATGIEP